MNRFWSFLKNGFGCVENEICFEGLLLLLLLFALVVILVEDWLVDWVEEEFLFWKSILVGLSICFDFVCIFKFSDLVIL